MQISKPCEERFQKLQRITLTVTYQWEEMKIYLATWQICNSKYTKRREEIDRCPFHPTEHQTDTDCTVNYKRKKCLLRSLIKAQSFCRWRWQWKVQEEANHNSNKSNNKCKHEGEAWIAFSISSSPQQVL